MPEAELDGVQPLPGEARAAPRASGRRRTSRRRRRGAAARPCAPGSGGCARSPGGSSSREALRERLERLVVRHRRLAARGRPRTSSRAPGCRPIGASIVPAQRVGVALHDRVVDLVDLAVVEGALQRRVRRLALRDDHEPAGAGVEAVHDARRAPAPRRSRPGNRRRPARRARSGRPSRPTDARRRRPACR